MFFSFVLLCSELFFLELQALDLVRKREVSLLTLMALLYGQFSFDHQAYGGLC